MRAIILPEVGNYDNLIFGEAVDPKPKSGEAVIKIHAAALNHRDLWITKGLYANIKVPIILGSDGCGVVTDTGSENDRHWIGKKVIVNPSMNWGDDPGVQGKDFRILGLPDNGTLAENVVVPTANLIEKPSYLSDEEAAAIPLAGLTAYRALYTQGNLQKNQTVLINGIGGGVAASAMQMALATDAKVIVTSGRDDKIRRAVSQGAVFGSNYNNPDGFKELIEKSKPLNGIDLIIDGAGGKGFNHLINVVKSGCRIVIYGATAGLPDSIDLRKVYWRQIHIIGSTMGTNDDFKHMIEFITAHKIKPVIDKVFSFSQFKEAFRQMDLSEQFGKIVLRP
ncbi:zinc-binding dehydrogenase [bacterium]|nr:zinc-binding dehydrogenase [bacterium]